MSSEVRVVRCRCVQVSIRAASHSITERVRTVFLVSVTAESDLSFETESCFALSAERRTASRVAIELAIARSCTRVFFTRDEKWDPLRRLSSSGRHSSTRWFPRTRCAAQCRRQCCGVEWSTRLRQDVVEVEVLAICLGKVGQWSSALPMTRTYERLSNQR